MTKFQLNARFPSNRNRLILNKKLPTPRTRSVERRKWAFLKSLSYKVDWIFMWLPQQMKSHWKSPNARNTVKALNTTQLDHHIPSFSFIWFKRAENTFHFTRVLNLLYSCTALTSVCIAIHTSFVMTVCSVHTCANINVKHKQLTEHVNIS